MLLEKRFLHQKSLRNCIFGLPETQSTKTLGPTVKNQRILNFFFDPLTQKPVWNTSKCHLVQGLSRCTGPLFSRSPVEMWERYAGQAQQDLQRDCIPVKESATILLFLCTMQAQGHAWVGGPGLRHLTVWTWTPATWGMAGNYSRLASGILFPFGKLKLIATPMLRKEGASAPMGEL